MKLFSFFYSSLVVQSRKTWHQSVSFEWNFSFPPLEQKWNSCCCCCIFPATHRDSNIIFFFFRTTREKNNPLNRSNSNSFPNYPSHWFRSFSFDTFLDSLHRYTHRYEFNEIGLHRQRRPQDDVVDRYRFCSLADEKSITFYSASDKEFQPLLAREHNNRGKIEKHFNVDVQFADEREMTRTPLEHGKIIGGECVCSRLSSSPECWHVSHKLRRSLERVRLIIQQTTRNLQIFNLPSECRVSSIGRNDNTVASCCSADRTEFLYFVRSR